MLWHHRLEGLFGWVDAGSGVRCWLGVALQILEWLGKVAMRCSVWLLFVFCAGSGGWVCFLMYVRLRRRPPMLVVRCMEHSNGFRHELVSVDYLLIG
jgi:hypothetical protein